MDDLQSINQDGTINIQYYKTAVIDIIERIRTENGIEAGRFTTLDLQSALRECYYALFADNKYLNCNIPYTSENITALLKMYYDICERQCMCFHGLRACRKKQCLNMLPTHV